MVVLPSYVTPCYFVALTTCLQSDRDSAATDKFGEEAAFGMCCVWFWVSQFSFGSTMVIDQLTMAHRCPEDCPRQVADLVSRCKPVHSQL